MIQMSLEQLIENYRPDREAVEIVSQTRLMFLVGIAGAGKNTLASLLLDNDEFMGIVSHTTRQPRVNNGVSEIDGVNYHFIDTTEAEAMLQAKQFVEAKYVHGTIYGTSVQSVKQIHDQGKIGLTDIDIQGVQEYRQMSSKIIPIFILPPDYETWKQRFLSRYNGQVQLDDFKRRCQTAIGELESVLQADYYHFIVNDDKHRAAKVIRQIAEGDVSPEVNQQARSLAEQLLAKLRD